MDMRWLGSWCKRHSYILLFKARLNNSEKLYRRSEMWSKVSRLLGFSKDV
jgi:hypothetical protein